jgi:G3E family GTPase
MKTTVVCGVLGAGKTTFLRNVLANGAEKAVVLVNDFGELGIDGEILSAGGVDTIQLRSGCVCCTLRTDLVAALRRILDEFQPEHLLIEPSGVATPSGVLDALALFKLSPVTVVGVVDATDFAKMYEAQIYGQFFEDQITNSDVILVNKTDLAPLETVEKTVALVGHLNAGALVVPTVMARLDADLPAQGRGEVRHRSDRSPPFEAISLRLENPVDIARCEDLFRSFASGDLGAVRRAKALVQTSSGPYRLDLSSGQVGVEKFFADVEESRIVVIGEGLNESAIRNAAGTGRREAP